MSDYVIWLDALGMGDVARVGGKNASLGEMISNLASAGVKVPGGFATTAHAFREFLRQDRLAERIQAALESLDVEDVDKLVETGKTIRQWVMDAEFPPQMLDALRNNYTKMVSEHDGELAVAVRSSATAEDLPEASFAGQQETYLNVVGFDSVLDAIKKVFASLYNDRAIAYRVHQKFSHTDVALSAGIQRMVRSDCGASGVMFTLDTESGFQEVVFITSSYGLGEMVVQGAVNPDEFYVHKPTLRAGRPAVIRRGLGSKMQRMVYNDSPDVEGRVRIEPVSASERGNFSLTDAQVEELAGYALSIEKHYGRPMDIEWALDGVDGGLYIVQARPETVKSNERPGQNLERFRLCSPGEVLATGRAIGQRIGQGPVRIIADAREMNRVQPGDVLVTDMTDPDWEPIMKRASAIVTNRGGRTCHAAIIAREMGIPAVVGCGNATDLLTDGQEVTVSCAEGDSGIVYKGKLKFEVTSQATGEMPELPVKVMMNVGNPGRAFDFAHIPNAGVGLARLEFIINTMIGIHPRALLDYANQSAELKAAIDARIAGYAGPVEFYIEKLVEGISTLAATFAPQTVIVRMSDFKSNEYANLLGGDIFEPHEENPMIGYRGTSRYLSEHFRPAFELEVKALRRVREEMGLTNVEVMIPFCRTLEEAQQVTALLAENGLERGKNGLRLIMMCEIPSNVILAEEFLQYFDGFSIGSNDMTQLTLGLDRDSAEISHLFDERNPAVKRMLQLAIQACRKQGKYVGICGQGPSDYPELALWLMEQGISSISLNPDTVVSTWLMLAEQAQQMKNPAVAGQA